MNESELRSCLFGELVQLNMRTLEHRALRTRSTIIVANNPHTIVLLQCERSIDQRQRWTFNPALHPKFALPLERIVAFQTVGNVMRGHADIKCLPRRPVKSLDLKPVSPNCKPVVRELDPIWQHFVLGFSLGAGVECGRLSTRFHCRADDHGKGCW